MRTTKVLACLCVAQVLLALPGLYWPAYLDSPLGLALVFPYFSVYIVHAIGVPGLLQNNGLCGWGWCAPTAIGWLLIAAVWLLVYWTVARIIAGLMGASQRKRT